MREKYKFTIKLLFSFVTSIILLGSATFVSLVHAGSYADIDIRVIIVSDSFPPAAVTNLVATPDIIEGSIKLTWTAPHEDGTKGGAVTSYILKYATFSVNSLAGNTTAWWNHPNTLTALEGGSPKKPGETETFIIGGLSPGIVYYFSIKSIDDKDNISLIDTKTQALNQANAPAQSVPPATINNLSAIAGPKYNEISLSWTAPGDDGWAGMATKYIIKYATYTITLSNFDSVVKTKERNVTVGGGNPDSEVITGLTGDTVYYFAIKTEDEVPNISNMSNVAFARTKDNVPPAAPVGLVAVGKDRKISLQWTANIESDLAGYNIYRSTSSMIFSATPINSSLISNTSYEDSGLFNGVTYFYVITAMDIHSNESSYSNEVLSMPKDTLPPQEPLGIKGIVSSDRTTMTISWSAVTNNEDGTPCEDLAGYNIYRASVLDGVYTIKDFVPAGQSLTWTDPENIKGQVFYYMVRAKDTSNNLSKISMIADSSVKMNIIVANEEDLSTNLTIPKEINQILYKDSNLWGDDIKIDIVRNTNEEQDQVIKSCAFIAKKGQSEEIINDFVFTAPSAQIVISYEVENGLVKTSKRAVSIPENQAANRLSLFWFNGLEWIKLGGEVDEYFHTVSIKSKRIGKYMIKQSIRATSFEIKYIQPDKTFSPNGDGWNDYFEIQYANPKDGLVHGKIYDLRGALVADMKKGANDETLVWDGKDSQGRVASGGVYIYQIEITGPESKVINGTCVLAR